MAFIKRFARGVGNHWKKSTFAACLLTYGGKWLKEKYEIDQLMRVYCEEALKYGEVAISGSVNPRTITIILNPAANKRKSVDDFESYCAPILNLAGICVDVLQTESEGHAKELVQNINSTDAVVVAGGDGTLSEVITGLLRRTGENNGEIIPVGVLPLGRNNSIGYVLFPGGGHLSKVKSLADAALAVVQEVTKPMDVMKVEIIGNDDDKDSSKPVYALSGIEWGPYRDASAKKDKYWYYGPLRNYVTYVFNGYKNNLCWNIDAVINYTPPCDGCSNCIIKRDDGINSKWYNRWFSRKSQANDRTYIINEECMHLQKKEVKTSDLALVTSNMVSDTSITHGPPRLHLNLGPDNIDYMDFVAEGWKTEQGESRQFKETIEARQIEIRPNISADGGDIWFSIDKEDFEVKPVKITLLPKLINMFCKKDRM